MEVFVTVTLPVLISGSALASTPVAMAPMRMVSPSFVAAAPPPPPMDWAMRAAELMPIVVMSALLRRVISPVSLELLAATVLPRVRDEPLVEPTKPPPPPMDWARRPVEFSPAVWMES